MSYKCVSCNAFTPVSFSGRCGRCGGEMIREESWNTISGPFATVGLDWGATESPITLDSLSIQGKPLTGQFNFNIQEKKLFTKQELKQLIDMLEDVVNDKDVSDTDELEEMIPLAQLLLKVKKEYTE